MRDQGSQLSDTVKNFPFFANAQRRIIHVWELFWNNNFWNRYYFQVHFPDGPPEDQPSQEEGAIGNFTRHDTPHPKQMAQHHGSGVKSVKRQSIDGPMIPHEHGHKVIHYQ